MQRNGSAVVGTSGSFRTNPPAIWFAAWAEPHRPVVPANSLTAKVIFRPVPHIKLATRISGLKYGQIPGYVRKRQANTGLMVKLSGWTQRRLREMENAAVDAWLRVRRRRHLNRAPHDFGHAKKRKRMVWKDRVDSLTDAEFLRTYRMTLETFTQVCNNIRTDITRKVPKNSRRDLHGAVPAELQLSMTLRYLAGGSYLDIYQMHGVGRTTFYDTLPIVCKAITKAYPLCFPVDDPKELVTNYN